MKYPILPIKNRIVFPGVVMPIFIDNNKSLNAVNFAERSKKYIFVAAQTKSDIDDPKTYDIYRFGTICRILQCMRSSGGNVKVMLEGVERGRIDNFSDDNGRFMEAEVTRVATENNVSYAVSEALKRSVLKEFGKYVLLNPKIASDLMHVVEDIEDISMFADVVSSHTNFKLNDKQELLETIEIGERLRKLVAKLMSENEILNLERDINAKVREEIDKGQKQYYLREQLKVIHDELDGGDNIPSEADELREKLGKSSMPDDVREKTEKEIGRFSKMAPLSPESTVSRNYIEWLLDMPWDISSEELIDINKAEQLLDKNHYGLEEAKDRILEYLSVRKLAKDNTKAQVLCFVGPPGVGKTSLGHSIAESMGRKLATISLGGMRDEAEIRGHRRTYIGALPGRIIQKIKQVGVNNPVILLDEIDKLGNDYKGDPSSALLEVLDPEQNSNFTDNFLEVPFDLSKVVFITTANNATTIPSPLLDRMEMIYLPGYVVEEKIEIAKKHLLPRVCKENGLKISNLSLSRFVLKSIITKYTMEAGVRNLERQLSKIARKAATKIVKENLAEDTKFIIKENGLSEYLGAPRQYDARLPKTNCVGTSIGLAWTAVGGDVLMIESAVMKGSGKISYTGNLGQIMKESIENALSFIRSNSKKLNVDKFNWQEHDIHVNVPEGAVPKDGPSAGITLTLSLCSAISNRKVDVSYAMTGEMTLHGMVLPIGGVREKLLAAKRYGIKKIIVPKDNSKDVAELKDWMTDGLELHYVSSVDEVLDLALVK